MQAHRLQIVAALVVAGIAPLSISLLLTLATQVALHAETSDGIVDSDDYDQWRTTFGQSIPAGSGADADGNGDGIIDAADYTVWRDNLNHDGSSPSRAVPEPSVAAVLILLLGGFWRQRHSY